MPLRNLGYPSKDFSILAHAVILEQQGLPGGLRTPVFLLLKVGCSCPTSVLQLLASLVSHGFLFVLSVTSSRSAFQEQVLLATAAIRHSSEARVPGPAAASKHNATVQGFCIEKRASVRVMSLNVTSPQGNALLLAEMPSDLVLLQEARFGANASSAPKGLSGGAFSRHRQ